MNIKHFNDIGYSVVIEPSEYHVDYAIYKHDGIYEDGKPVFHKAGDDHFPSPIASTENAEVYIHGSVKWDGCSNWGIDENDRCMLHGCDKDDLLNFGKIMAACWDMTEQHCKKWSPC